MMTHEDKVAYRCAAIQGAAGQEYGESPIGNLRAPEAVAKFACMVAYAMEAIEDAKPKDIKTPLPARNPQIVSRV